MTVDTSTHTALLALALVGGMSAPVLAQHQIPAEIAVGDHILSGTLTVPAGEGPFPAAVLISGSGRSDRDESLPGVPFRPFLQLATELQAAGIATLRYDDRGFGRSTGDFHAATAYDFADDAQAAAAFLATQPGIDPTHIGLIGHSEGGMVAPIVARRDDTISFVVSLAGTAVPGYEVLAGQLRDVLAGAPEDQQEALYKTQIRSLDLVVAEDWPALEQLLREEHAAMPADAQAEVGPLDDYVTQGMIFYRGWLHTFATHDPAEDWQRVEVPVLALFGGRDVQVNAAVNAPALEAALAHNDDVTVTVHTTANHLFQETPTGAVEEYATLPARFVPGFVAAIADWISARHLEP